MRGLYEALSRKHAMEYARLTKEYEEMGRASGEQNKEEVTKDQELHRKMEDMLSLTKDMASKPNLCSSEPRYEEMLSFFEREGREGYETKDEGIF